MATAGVGREAWAWGLGVAALVFSWGSEDVSRVSPGAWGLSYLAWGLSRGTKAYHAVVAELSVPNRNSEFRFEGWPGTLRTPFREVNGIQGSGVTLW